MEHHVVVVGAGPAGLAAALELRGRGLRVTLLERAAAAGGRARDDDAPGAAASLVGAGDARVRTLFERAAGEGGRATLRPAAFARWRDGALEPLAAPRRGVARARAALALARVERIERRYADLLDRDAPERAERFDDRSVAAMARLYLPRSVLARELAPLAEGVGLGDVEEASRVPGLLLRRSLAEPPSALRGGVDLLAAAAARICELRLGLAAELVEATATGALRVGTAGGATVACDAVLLATPAAVARRLAEPLLTTPERELLGRARAAAAVVLHAALERAPAPRPTRVLVPAEAGLPVAWLDLAPGGTHAPQSGGLATLVAASAWSRARLDAPDDALEKELSSLLAHLVPGSARELRLARIARHADAFPLFPVGRYRELARFQRIQADRRSLGRRLYFAGDHLGEPTLEGAVRSALRSVADIAADLAGQTA